MNYADQLKTTQQEKSHKKQKKNNAGGYSFKLKPFKQLERFLILGSEGGTYYVGQKQLTKDNAKIVEKCYDKNPQKTLDLIVDVSVNNRAPKNSPAIFALALCTTKENSKPVFDAMLKVCRTGTHLFEFVDYMNQLRGWGVTARKGVSEWYTSKSPEDLAYQVTKYQQRMGWSHRDVLRKCHAHSENVQEVLQYVTQKEKWGESSQKLRLLENVERAKSADTKELVRLILEEGLVREHLPTEALNKIEIWDALLQNMPATAMLRNLGKMTNIGLLKPLSGDVNKVCQKFEDESYLKKSRLHPMTILLGMRTYSNGKGVKGSLSWSPVPQLVSSLEDAFYKSFNLVEPTNKKYLLGIDVSGSMSWTGSTGIMCSELAAAMAMLTVKTEKQHFVHGFGSTFIDLGINSKMSLNEVMRQTGNRTFGTTDCALPMLYAMQNNLEVDVFAVYTDNETWFGSIHPHTALEQYRQKSGIDSKLIVYGMAANRCTIANPDDPGMLDVIGFDTSVPQVAREFILS